MRDNVFVHKVWTCCERDVYLDEELTRVDSSLFSFCSSCCCCRRRASFWCLWHLCLALGLCWGRGLSSLSLWLWWWLVEFWRYPLKSCSILCVHNVQQPNVFFFPLISCMLLYKIRKRTILSSLNELNCFYSINYEK